MGKPLPGIETRIVDGELQLRAASSPTFFSRYLDGERFEGEWWPTGDLVSRGRGRLPLLRGPRRRHHPLLRLPDRPDRGRGGAALPPGGRRGRRGRRPRPRARLRRPGDRRPPRRRAQRGARRASCRSTASARPRPTSSPASSSSPTSCRRPAAARSSGRSCAGSNLEPWPRSESERHRRRRPRPTSTRSASRDLDAMTALLGARRHRRDPRPGRAGRARRPTAPGSATSSRPSPTSSFEVLDDRRRAARRRPCAGAPPGTFDGAVRFEGLVAQRRHGSTSRAATCSPSATASIHRNDAYMNGAEMARQLGALPPAGSLPEQAADRRRST